MPVCGGVAVGAAQMATRLISWKRAPGAEGPFRVASRRAAALLWGTNLRRTFTALALVLVAVSGYFLLLRGSAVRLLQLSLLLSVFVVILLKPHVGVIALRFYNVFERSLKMERLIRGAGVTLTKSIGLFTLIAFIALLVAKRVKPVFGHKTQMIFMYGLLGSVLISSFAALYWKNVWVHMFQMVQNIIFYIIFVNLFAEAKWLTRFMWVITISVLLACLSGFFSVALSGVIRAAGTLGNANGLAMVANQGAAILLVLALAETDVKKKSLFLSALTLTLMAIIFTGSRGGLLTVLLTFAYQLVKRRKNLIPYFAAVLLLVGAFAVIPEQYKQRQEEWFGALIGGETAEATGGSRGYIYRSAFDIFKRSPLIGVGPRTFGHIYQEEYAPGRRGSLSRVKVVHSGILEVLVENGILGFAFFIGLIISTYLIFRANARRCRKANLEGYPLLNDVFEALFIAIIVSGSFESIVKSTSFFLALAAAASIHRATVTLAAAAPERPGAAVVPAPQTAPG
jgi:O-antigen ligase